MSYYQGDFYQGDFYQGDPGFFSLIGRAIGGVTGLVRRARGAGGLIPGTRVPAGTLAARGMEVGRTIAGKVMKHPVLSAAGAAGVIGAIGGGAAMREAMPGAAMRGFHVSKKTGRLVRNRRMRVTNPKALRRAIRRAHGFEKLARRVMHFTSPRPIRGRAIFKRRRRAK